MVVHDDVRSSQEGCGVWLNRVSRSGSLLLCLGRGTVSRPHCRRVLYCVCSDDLYFMFGVTLLSLDVADAES